MRVFSELSFYVVLLLLSLSTRGVLGSRMTDFEMMEMRLGDDLGVRSGQKEVDDGTLKTVLEGVKKHNPNSMYFYGLFKLYGISVPQDEKAAAEMFRKGADLDHPESMTAYAVMLVNGQGIKEDQSKAMHYFRKAVNKGDMNAHWLLGKTILEDERIQPPPEVETSETPIPIPPIALALHKEAFDLFQKAADAGLKEGRHYLALMYEYGFGCQQNFESAIEQYQRASNQDYFESTYNLALMYAYGRAPKQDFRKALSLLERGARAEHAPSIYYMGVFKMYGYGCEPDYERAQNWFERAAGMEDFRISEQAARAANELRVLMLSADDKNNQVLAAFERRVEEL